jgi:hypothetical protein
MADGNGPGLIRSWAGAYPVGALTVILAVAWLGRLHPLAGWAFLAWVAAMSASWVRWKVLGFREWRDERRCGGE